MALLMRLHQADTRLFSRLFKKGEQWQRFRAVARILSRSGDGHLQILLPLWVWLLDLALADTYLVLLALAFSLERGAYFLLKNTLKRRRPQDAMPGFRSIIQASDQFSFPSGHSSAAFCLATATGIVFGGPVIALYLWAGAVALSRVLMGVHFPGDTVAGALLGSGLALLAAACIGCLPV
jgi:undecaprenyl-diphosphatase